MKNIFLCGSLLWGDIFLTTFYGLYFSHQLYNYTLQISEVRKWLQLYGELVTDITEDSHYDPDPDSAKVGNGIYSVKMKINKQIPYMTVKHVLF